MENTRNNTKMKSLKNRINIILSVVFVTLLTFTSCSDPFNSGSRKNTGTTDVTMQIPAELFRAIDASRDGVEEGQSSDSKTASLTIYLYVNKDAPIIKTVSNVDKQKGAEVSFPDIEVGARVWAYAEIQIGSEEYTAFSESTLVSANGTEIILTLELSKINLELGIEEALEQIGSVTVNCYLKITGRLSASQLEELFYKMNYLDRVQIDLDLSETTGLTELERGCANVKSWVLPSSIEYINEGALSNCGWIEDISFPDGNENYLVEDDILYNTAKTLIIRCITSKKTDEFTIPSTVTKIGDAAFFNCRLTKINIPASVESIGAGAFQSSYNLTEFNVASDNANYKSVDGVLFTKDGKELIQYPLLKEGDTYTIPEGVEVIRWYAFGNGYELKTITVPSSAIEIEYGAFWSEEIDSVIFEAPQGWYDYDGNLILEDEISNAVTTRWASYSKMKTETVTADSLYDLIDNYEAERAITYEVTGSMTNDELNDLFNMMNEKRRNRWVSLDMRNVSGITELERVPNVMKFGIPSGVTSIIEGAFTYTPEILISSENDSFVLEDDVLYTSDKSRLLWYGRNKTATSFTIPDSVVTIDSWGIFGNEFIQEINIPASVQSLGSYNVHNMSAIFECKNLETITVESNSKFYEVVDGVLFEKRSRTLIAYPPSMQGESYTIPDTTTTIIYGAFAYAKNLKSVTVSESVTQLGVNVFSASSLETIVFEDPDDWYIDNNGNKISVTSDQLQNPANYSSTWDGGTGYFENVRLIKEAESYYDFYYIYWGDILIEENGIPVEYLDPFLNVLSTEEYEYTIVENKIVLTDDIYVKTHLQDWGAVAGIVYDNKIIAKFGQADVNELKETLTTGTHYTVEQKDDYELIYLTDAGYEMYLENFAVQFKAETTSTGVKLTVKNLPREENQFTVYLLDPESAEGRSGLFNYSGNDDGITEVELNDIFVTPGVERKYELQISGFSETLYITCTPTAGSGILDFEAQNTTNGVSITFGNNFKNITNGYNALIRWKTNGDVGYFASYDTPNTDNFIDKYVNPNVEYEYNLESRIPLDDKTFYYPTTKRITITPTAGLGEFVITNNPIATVDYTNSQLVFSELPVLGVSATDLPDTITGIKLELSYSDQEGNVSFELLYDFKNNSTTLSLVDIFDEYVDYVGTEIEFNNAYRFMVGGLPECQLYYYVQSQDILSGMPAITISELQPPENVITLASSQIGAASSSDVSDYVMVSLSQTIPSVVYKIVMEEGKTYHFQEANAGLRYNIELKDNPVYCTFQLRNSSYRKVEFDSFDNDGNCCIECLEDGEYYYVITLEDTESGNAAFHIWEGEDNP